MSIQGYGSSQTLSLLLGTNILTTVAQGISLHSMPQDVRVGGEGQWPARPEA